MSKTLVLTLSGPVQAYGAGGTGSLRPTLDYPTRSAVTGMCCAALGIDREDPEASTSSPNTTLSKLNRLGFGVRVDEAGEHTTDYQTVHKHMLRDYGRPPRGDEEAAIITHREYLIGASFTVALNGPEDIIEQLYAAFLNPAFTVTLGRRCCLPSRPLVGHREESILDCGVEDALRRAPLAGAAGRYGADDTVERTVVLDDMLYSGFDRNARRLTIPDMPERYASDHRAYSLRPMVVATIKLNVKAMNAEQPGPNTSIKAGNGANRRNKPKAGLYPVGAVHRRRDNAGMNGDSEQTGPYITILKFGRNATKRLTSNEEYMHAAVYSGFNGAILSQDGTSRVLYRVERSQNGCTVVVSSPTIPDYTGTKAELEHGATWETRSYAAIRELRNGAVVRLRMAYSPKDRMPGTEARFEAMRKLEANGFSVTAMSYDERATQVGKASGGFVRHGVTITGIAKITDPKKAKAAMLNGLGRGKAYGYGLITLLNG